MKNRLLFYMEDGFCTTYKLALHHLKQCLVANGCGEVTTSQEADIAIAGVCCAFEADEKRSVTLLDKLKEVGKPIYIIGCMVRLRREEMPSDHLFYSWEYEKLFRELAPEPSVAWRDISLPTEFRCLEDYRVYDPNKRFMGICSGCAFDCSYCPHKVGAGDLVSRSVESILGQIEGLLQQSITTITLTGIDTASYGRDIDCSFPLLMERILAITHNEVSYHIAQFNPEGLVIGKDQGDMVRCCSDPRVSDLQLPIQTTSSRLLKLMNRNYSASDVAEFIEHIQCNNKNLFLRTDLMIGFPTETEEEFQASTLFAAKYFQEVALYTYEHKSGTPIEKMRLPQCDPEIIDKRLQKAMTQLTDTGCLIHSGAQDMASLLSSDKAKYERQGVKE